MHLDKDEKSIDEVEDAKARLQALHEELGEAAGEVPAVDSAGYA